MILAEADIQAQIYGSALRDQAVTLYGWTTSSISFPRTAAGPTGPPILVAWPSSATWKELLLKVGIGQRLCQRNWPAVRRFFSW